MVRIKTLLKPYVQQRLICFTLNKTGSVSTRSRISLYMDVLEINRLSVQIVTDKFFLNMSQIGCVLIVLSGRV